MDENMENQPGEEGECPVHGKSCTCEKHPMHCLEKVMHENPMKAVWWCLGIGFLLGWKIKNCLHHGTCHKS